AELADVVKVAGMKDDTVPVTSPHQASLACALARGGAVWCWGDGQLGQLGGVTPPPPTPTPPPSNPLRATKIDNLPPATDIAVGGSFACAVTADGAVYCWGSNREGRAPNGAPRARAIPVPVRWP